GHPPLRVCLHPASRAYLPAVAPALDPVLRELAGLPGAPVRISQTAAVYRQGPGNSVQISGAGPALTGAPPVFHLLLPIGPGLVSSDQLAAQVRTRSALEIVDSVVGGGDAANEAQQAVREGILKTATLPPGTPAAAAAARFAALSATARHAWLEKNVADLRAG